jgi:hypothetical protein
MRYIRGFLFLPVLALALPALTVIFCVILIVDSKQGPLRTLLAKEVSRHGWSQGFERFMQQVFIPQLQHNVHSFVLGGAGFLVVVVGLRGLGMLPIELVYAALGVEFTLLTTWSVTTYFTPSEEAEEEAGSPLSVQHAGITQADAAAFQEKLLRAVQEMGAKLAPPVDNEKLIAAMHAMTTQLASLGDQDKLIRSMHDMTAQLALLENRLRVTESRFENLAGLDTSIQNLSTKLNAIVSDQFNLRVRREFEGLLSELGSHLINGNGNHNAKAA